ncbi:MerR family transcriptional regulator [Pectinatus haikarae]|uniref:DNA-binding transcriptional MerR regulator n=1 Tax=Pectinatus haikarae TaxID=349096 RepID=A0ABT9YAI7_9FIRM|nr:hypothetical protein [Pectinatus haikarae]MDQ0204746.1 DNA-binding transcriptional MerR regulator [Pectinatus haikarae]
MNREAVHKKYSIPFEVLKKYESSSIAKVQSEGAATIYDDYALKELSFIMSLLDFGFSWDEIMSYMKMKKDSKYCHCMDLLNEKRNDMLEEIHKKEQMISRIDYLKYEMKKDLDDTKG